MCHCDNCLAWIMPPTRCHCCGQFVSLKGRYAYGFNQDAEFVRNCDGLEGLEYIIRRTLNENNKPYARKDGEAK